MRSALQDVQRAPDVGRRAFLAGVGDDVQAELAAAREHAGEFFGRVTELAGVEAHADEGVAKGQRLLPASRRPRCSDRWRRKHRISALLMPRSRRASSQARVRPRITVSRATPRAVCVCGSKKISACTTFSAWAARAR
jgi:hypothetical protein